MVQVRTKCRFAVELLREQARVVEGEHMRLFDSGYALESVVRPLVLPNGGTPGSISSPACGATLGCSPCPCPRSSAQREAGTEAAIGVSGWSHPPGRHVEGEVAADRLRLGPTAIR